MTAVAVVVWVALLVLAIKIEFAAVYVLITGFVLVFMNLDSSPKTKAHKSAYAAFNTDGYRIPGANRDLLSGVGGLDINSCAGRC